MNCENIKNIIITDLIDGELSQPQEAVVKQHLENCAACRQYLNDVKKSIVEPFQNVPSQKLPEGLWLNIKTAIESQPKEPVFNPLGVFTRLLRLPRSIFTLSTSLAILLIGLVLIKSPNFFINLENRQLAKEYLEEQIDFLTPENGSTKNNDAINLHTDIEKFLL